MLSSKRTVADIIIDTLRTSDRPLMQADIASRAQLLAPTVRRTCQSLLKSGEIVRLDYNGWMGNPRFVVAPWAVELPVSTPAPVFEEETYDGSPR
jgi:hypothetical protein